MRRATSEAGGPSCLTDALVLEPRDAPIYQTCPGVSPLKEVVTSRRPDTPGGKPWVETNGSLGEQIQADGNCKVRPWDKTARSSLVAVSRACREPCVHHSGAVER